MCQNHWLYERLSQSLRLSGEYHFSDKQKKHKRSTVGLLGKVFSLRRVSTPHGEPNKVAETVVKKEKKHSSWQIICKQKIFLIMLSIPCQFSVFHKSGYGVNHAYVFALLFVFYVHFFTTFSLSYAMKICSLSWPIPSQIRTGWTRLENLNLARTLTREASLSVPLATKFSTHTKLGGHRSSHKKIKGCFASRNESSESNECVVEHQHGASFHNEVETVNESKKSKGHECPICLKVFPCGQALGGHKRSHMVGGFESRSFQTIVLQEPVAEIRDFLDLNLPAATKEESNSHADSNSNIPWWIVEDNHK
ncbi:Zinc finger protein ZAT4 [Glycine soja]|uniref:Zinc finger protein ZAT4 n=1 Tax=Glycine soja TaxID=3848 RepID=A0A445I1Y8_GLYSO|nr:Zinc finger protein ZAT4 [Glycine soja]